MSTDLCAIAAALLLLAPEVMAQTEPRSNFFRDPFVQATKAMKNCPVPEGPLYTDAEAKTQSHSRAEKGTTCHYYGRCRLANAYLYDPDIIARSARFLALDGRFDHTSVWLLGQRRWVYLRGCVESRAEAEALLQQVELIDDVEKVIDQLMVGEDGMPPYPTAAADAKPKLDRRPCAAHDRCDQCARSPGRHCQGARVAGVRSSAHLSTILRAMFGLAPSALCALGVVFDLDRDRDRRRNKNTCRHDAIIPP